MFDSIWSDIKREYRYGNNITRLIIINVFVFVLINIIKLFFIYGNGLQPSSTFSTIIEWLAISANVKELVMRPWTFITSMFLHLGFWHLLWNMLVLYWFGRIVADFIGNHRVIPIYLLGGIAGGIAFIISENIFGYGGGSHSIAYGASAATMAFVVASAKISPDYVMRLLFIGDVKIKYIAAVLLFMDLIGTASQINTGGHFGHLGGALLGFVYAALLQQGTDLAEPLNNMFNKIRDFFSGNPKTTPTPRKRKRYTKVIDISQGKRNQEPGPAIDFEEKLDYILDKIKNNGMDSLSDDEKDFLHRASKKD